MGLVVSKKIFLYVSYYKPMADNDVPGSGVACMGPRGMVGCRVLKRGLLNIDTHKI